MGSPLHVRTIHLSFIISNWVLQHTLPIIKDYHRTFSLGFQYKYICIRIYTKTKLSILPESGFSLSRRSSRSYRRDSYGGEQSPQVIVSVMSESHSHLRPTSLQRVCACLWIDSLRKNESHHIRLFAKCYALRQTHQTARLGGSNACQILRVSLVQGALRTTGIWALGKPCLVLAWNTPYTLQMLQASPPLISRGGLNVQAIITGNSSSVFSIPNTWPTLK